MKILLISLPILLLLYAQSAVAEKNTAVEIVTDNLTWLCDKPRQAGSRWEIKVKGDGDAGLRIKAMPKLGVSGEVEFREEEWTDIKNTIENTMDYRECVEKLLPVFLERFTPLVESAQSEQSLLKSKKTLGGIKYVDYQGGVELTLEGCVQRSDTVACDFTAVSEDSDSEITLNGESAIYDENGGKTFTTYARVANFERKIKAGNGNSYLSSELVYDVRTPVLIRFQGVKPEIEAITKVSISSRISNNAGSNYFVFDFRDVDMPLDK